MLIEILIITIACLIADSIMELGRWMLRRYRKQQLAAKRRQRQLLRNRIIKP